ncbi:MAG: hypothetical protein GX241_03115 [Ruminococcaceae bacterium]|nr:hypothetical protein [Oscillospiraceae bacterium]
MKSEKLYESITFIDEDIIEEAEMQIELNRKGKTKNKKKDKDKEKIKTKVIYKKLIPIAACFVLLFVIAIPLINQNLGLKSNDSKYAFYGSKGNLFDGFGSDIEKNNEAVEETPNISENAGEGENIKGFSEPRPFDFFVNEVDKYYSSAEEAQKDYEKSNWVVTKYGGEKYVVLEMPIEDGGKKTVYYLIETDGKFREVVDVEKP